MIEVYPPHLGVEKLDSHRALEVAHTAALAEDSALLAAWPPCTLHRPTRPYPSPATAGTGMTTAAFEACRDHCQSQAIGDYGKRTQEKPDATNA